MMAGAAAQVVLSTSAILMLDSALILVKAATYTEVSSQTSHETQQLGKVRLWHSPVIPQASWLVPLQQVHVLGL